MFDFSQPAAFGKAGVGGDGSGVPSLASPANATGGKAVIKFNPTNDEITSGIRAQATLFSWQSPDGQPHFVTVDVGRIANGVGGPNADGTSGQTPISQMGSLGGGSFPAAQDAAGNPLYYRAVAQILLGTPGTMQDPFFIDINRGQRLTACVSYVAVTAMMRSTPVSENDGAVIVPSFGGNPFVSGSICVYSTLGVGFAPSQAPLLYTQYIDSNFGDVVPGSIAYNRITPPRANRLLSAQSTNGGNGLKVEFAAPAAAGFITPPFTNGELGVFGNGLPISADGDVVILTSTSGVAASFKLVYQISV